MDSNTGMPKRDFLKLLAAAGGGLLALEAPPLRRVNLTFAGEAQAACTRDTCIVDACTGDTKGHICKASDVCETDASGDCTRDRCKTDFSGTCTDDRCASDKSGSCKADGCTSDKSGSCETDACGSDKSDTCRADRCTGDPSGACVSDSCTSDKSGDCINDECPSDKSGSCRADACRQDISGACKADHCTLDASGAGENDECTTDRSGACTNDACKPDYSQACRSDRCSLDASGTCVSDRCSADRSGSCVSDDCGGDLSDACQADACTRDASLGCVKDRCNGDFSGACESTDVCILDRSTNCLIDLCRSDKSPAAACGSADVCGPSDTCAIDLASSEPIDRRRFAQKGLNSALRMLYRLSAVALALGLTAASARAATAINAAEAVFEPAASFQTAQSVEVTAPVGPFLRDCDDDSVLEADTNGDGACDGDPEVTDADGDGTRELPAGTSFTGDFAFTCFHVPADVAIAATGTLTIGASSEVAVFGTMRLAGDTVVASPKAIDLRTSAWWAESGNLRFDTAVAGAVARVSAGFAAGVEAPQVHFVSLCAGAGPMIRKIDPLRGTLGSTLTIQGSGFGTATGKVFIRGVAAKVLSWSPTSVTCTVATLPPVGPQQVRVVPRGGKEIVAAAAYQVEPPLILWIEGEMRPGTNATVTGSFFGSAPGHVRLGARACRIVSWKMDSATGRSKAVVTLPAQAPGDYLLTLTAAGGRAVEQVTIY